MMKFINIVTESKQDYLNKIIMKMSIPEVDFIRLLYSKFESIEYIDDEDYECMFAILDDNLILDISNLYKKYGIKFKVIDLSNDIFYDNNFDILFENNMNDDVSIPIIELISKFKNNFITKDIILDKILSKGINSLTEFDKKILDN